MPSWIDQLRFAYQPVVNLVTGSVVALEVLARPESGDVLAAARRSPDVDAELAALAVRSAVARETLLPLHVNLYAATLAALPHLAALSEAVAQAGRRPWEITVDVGAPFSGLWQDPLREAVRSLREQGYRICVDGVGDGDVPLRLLAELAPDIVKADASLTRALPDGAAERAMVASLRDFCEAIGGRLAVEGVETERQFAAVRSLGVPLAQGDLFAPAARRPVADVYHPAVPAAPAAVAAPAPAGPPVADFLRPAALLPLTVSAGQVRDLLTRSEDVSDVVLVDDDGIPVQAIDRDRFLLSMSGRYGHALHADRPALRLGEQPRTVALTATAWEVVDAAAADSRPADGDLRHRSDCPGLRLWPGAAHPHNAGDTRAADPQPPPRHELPSYVAVVDRAGRCVGVVRLADIVRALAESRVEEAASLNPLTRLPGSDAVGAEVERRIGEGPAFCLSWLDVDGFKRINDGAGFAAGDELIRSVGHCLAQAAAGLAATRVGHIGGDDFLVLSAPEELPLLAAAVLDREWSAGGLPVSLSLATLVCEPGRVADHRDAAAQLAPLKKEAKALPGTSWVRGAAGGDRHDVLRAGARAWPPPAA